MLFEFIIFRFDLVLFKYYFLFELFYFKQIIIFQERISEDSVLEQKKEDYELIRDENMKYGTKICHPQSQRHGTARASSGTAVPPFKVFFSWFCFPDKLPISLLLT